ncbi:CPBP family intramembrane glutamic endopeptidase [Nocardia sp. 348MFTsu5.1]|uniref:CPBP family intramembrane glutamic endopeptidase n=1 Tax=Nocardia sp. 348MFTsu5.1 TaxID=1172185 RepID=UPI00037DB20D|nr:type II CAAX endopeptidase family protein [Nocardia sp. 348MFTsu5.1]
MFGSNAFREIAVFVAVAYSLAIGIAVVLPDAGINTMLSVLVPVVTVAIMTFTIIPKGKRRELWNSFGLRRSGGSALRPALAIPMVLVILAYGAAVLSGVADFVSIHFTPLGSASWVADLVIELAIGTVFILGEEIGWRGFLLPRIQQFTNRRKAAVLTGFIHGCFHLPLILIATTYDADGSRWIVAPMAVATITVAGIFYAYLWDRSHTVWPVAVAHNAANTAFVLGAAAVVAASPADLAYVAGESGIATFGAVILVGAVYLGRAKVWRRDLPLVEDVQVNPKLEVAMHH